MAEDKAIDKLKVDLNTISQVDGRAGADTIRLWEGYREQAFMWRAISIIQMPATLFALLGMLIMYLTADITIEPPEHPQPGIYSVKYLPDSEFLRAATELVNLIASYQPRTAEIQFKKAREMLWEPALTEFEDRMIGDELQKLIMSNRSQVFLVNNRLVRIQRFPQKDVVVVRLPGTLQKLISNSQALETEEYCYYIKMTTIPRSVYNESGIVVIDIRVKKQSSKEIDELDQQEQKMLG
ncbi:MAG: hypothetical protein IT292_12425 [Deltaproteobacteria bacterium]|nr:hypothetical protein [Deltaproteobacteria bacterium]